MSTGDTSLHPALRAAVDASLSWYDALCALHSVPCGIEDDVWCAYSTPPPLHSAAKTVEPTARSDQALAAVTAESSIADPFGTLDLHGEGFRVLFASQWIHRPAPAVKSRHLPPGWVVVRTESELRAWTSHHDTESVLPPALLQRSAFRVIGRAGGLGDGHYDAGAVLHLCSGVVDVSNVWAAPGLDWAELVAAAAACFPSRALVGYERGADLEDAQAAGFVTLGPQRV